jgi:hypothetical protein
MVVNLLLVYTLIFNIERFFDTVCNTVKQIGVAYC